MKNETSKRLQDNFDKDNKLKSELNYGIADMEAGRELPLDEAMEKITELRNVFSGLEKLEKHDKQKHLYQLMTMVTKTARIQLLVEKIKKIRLLFSSFTFFIMKS